MGELGGRVRDVFRYPVKSVGGERLIAADVDDRAIVGDRLWAIETVEHRLASGKNSQRFRRRDGVFDLLAATTTDSEGGQRVEVTFPMGARAEVGTPRADAMLREHLGEECRFAREGEVAGIASHMDAEPVSIVGSASLRALADLVGDVDPVDPRHLRANLVIETESPWVEDTWVGRRLLIGGVVLEVAERTVRCRMVDVGQVDVPAHGRLLKALGERDLCAAVYARVMAGGVLRPDDDVGVL